MAAPIVLISPLEYSVPLAHLSGRTLASIQEAYKTVMDRTSFGILLFWARQRPLMDAMRESVLDSINVQKERKAAVILQKELVMEEARVIGWVLTQLDAVPPAVDPLATGRTKVLRDKLQVDYQSMAKTLADIAKDGTPTEAAEASTLQTMLFGTQLPQRRRGDRDRSSAPVVPPSGDSRLSSASSSAAETNVIPTSGSKRRIGTNSTGFAIHIDPNADIGGELSFDDGAS